MRIPKIGNLAKDKARNKAIKMLKKVGIKKKVYVIQAEYRAYCSEAERTPKDKMGFLWAIRLVSDDEAKEWIEQERAKLDKIIKNDETGAYETGKQLSEEYAKKGEDLI